MLQPIAEELISPPTGSTTDGWIPGQRVRAPRTEALVIHGDCEAEVAKLAHEGETVSLIVTSPPYSNQRASTYGGIHPNNYVEWFIPKANEFAKILSDDGSFILNIKERTFNGERHTYVIELILAMREAGWRWVEEYCWHKKNCYPGKWPNRFRDSFERILHFTRNKHFKMRQEAVMVPTGEWKRSRLHNLSERDRTRDESRVGNGFGKRVENWIGRERAYPTNVLHIATECSNQGHSAAFPLALPEFFVKLFTDPNDTVLDPFAGSGTSLVAALALGRRSIGIESVASHCDLMMQRLGNARS